MFEITETVVLDDGLPGQCLVTIVDFIDDDEIQLMASVVDEQAQMFTVSLFRLSKPF